MQAWAVLGDENERARYDQELLYGHRDRSGTPSPEAASPGAQQGRTTASDMDREIRCPRFATTLCGSLDRLSTP